MVGEGAYDTRQVPHLQPEAKHTGQDQIVLVEESLNWAVSRSLSGPTAPDRDKEKLKVTAGLLKSVDSRQHKSAEKCTVWQVHR